MDAMSSRASGWIFGKGESMTHYERLVKLAELTDRTAARFAESGDYSKATEYHWTAIMFKGAAKGLTVEEAVSP